MTPTEEVVKLRNAIKAAGFAVMETSGAWSIHDVSENGKRLEDEDLKRANQIVDLEIENHKLRAKVEEYKGFQKRVNDAINLGGRVVGPATHRLHLLLSGLELADFQEAIKLVNTLALVADATNAHTEMIKGTPDDPTTGTEPAT